MAGGELRFRTHVDHCHRAVTFAPDQLGSRDRFHLIALAKKLINRARRLGVIAFRDGAKGVHQCDDGVVGESIMDMLSLAPIRHHSTTPQLLEVLRYVRHRQAGYLRQILDRLFPLGKMLQEFKTRRAAEGLGDFSQVNEQNLLGAEIRVTSHTVVQ